MDTDQGLCSLSLRSSLQRYCYDR